MEIKNDVTKNRTIGIGGSDCYTLWHGNNDDIENLWLEKTKQKGPKDLSKIFAVRLGTYTEPLNIEVLTEKLLSPKRQTNKGMLITDAKDIAIEKKSQIKIPMDDGSKKTLTLYAHLDAYIKSHHCIIECKHTNADNTLEDLVQKYNPQMQHYMHVFDVNHAIISGIFGNRSHMFKVVERDDEFISRLITIQKKFWSCVIDNVNPKERFANQ